jgi:hypothetical protein
MEGSKVRRKGVDISRELSDLVRASGVFSGDLRDGV